MDLHNELILITIGWVDTSHLVNSVSFAKMRVNATTGMKIDMFLTCSLIFAGMFTPRGKDINWTANLLSSLCPLVQSVSDLLSIIQFLSDCKFCISNDDERYSFGGT